MDRQDLRMAGQTQYVHAATAFTVAGALDNEATNVADAEVMDLHGSET